MTELLSSVKSWNRELSGCNRKKITRHKHSLPCIQDIRGPLQPWGWQHEPRHQPSRPSWSGSWHLLLWGPCNGSVCDEIRHVSTQRYENKKSCRLSRHGTHLSRVDTRSIGGVALEGLEGVEVTGGTGRVGVPLVVDVLLGILIPEFVVVLSVYESSVSGGGSSGRCGGGGGC